MDRITHQLVEQLERYLLHHERDIAISNLDYGSLRELFVALFYREPEVFWRG